MLNFREISLLCVQIKFQICDDKLNLSCTSFTLWFLIPETIKSHIQHYKMHYMKLWCVACICDFRCASCKGEKKCTQTNPVSAGVNSFSYDCGRAHDQCSDKDPDDRSCVCRGGCWDKTRQRELLLGGLWSSKREEQQVYQHSRAEVDTCSDWLVVSCILVHSDVVRMVCSTHHLSLTLMFTWV